MSGNLTWVLYAWMSKAEGWLEGDNDGTLEREGGFVGKLEREGVFVGTFEREGALGGALMTAATLWIAGLATKTTV